MTNPQRKLADSIYYHPGGSNYLCTRDEVTDRASPLMGPLRCYEVVALINAQPQPEQYVNMTRHKLDRYYGFSVSKTGEQALKDRMSQNAHRLESMDRLGCVLHVSANFRYAYSICFTLSADKTRLERHFIYDHYGNAVRPQEYSTVDWQAIG